MAIFDIYHAGYERGVHDGRRGLRRKARWEILLRSPISWLPLVDETSFVRGYAEGYLVGASARQL